MFGVAFVFENGNVDLYIPAASPAFVSVPEGVIIHKHLRSFPDTFYNAGVNTSVATPTLTLTIDNKYLAFNSTLIKSRYLKSDPVTACWVVEFADATFEFEILKLAVADSYIFKGSLVDLTLR